jgi:SprT-like family
MSESLIEVFVEKYMEVLDIEGQEPDIVIVDNLGSKWLGLCEWKPSRPDTTTIYLQRRIIDDEGTLERVVAHEMIHHEEMLNLSDVDKALLKLGRGRLLNPHGPSFKRGQALINEVMGDDFVSEKSDQSFVYSKNERSFYVLIMEGPRGKLGWAWAVRLSPQMKNKVAREVASGAKLVMTTDVRWTAGVKIKSGMSLPRNDEETAALAELAEEPSAEV